MPRPSIGYRWPTTRCGSTWLGSPTLARVRRGYAMAGTGRSTTRRRQLRSVRSHGIRCASASCCGMSESIRRGSMGRTCLPRRSAMEAVARAATGYQRSTPAACRAWRTAPSSSSCPRRLNLLAGTGTGSRRKVAANVAQSSTSITHAFSIRTLERRLVESIDLVAGLASTSHRQLSWAT